MTSQTESLPLRRCTPEMRRARHFAWLMVAAVVWGALVGVLENPDAFAAVFLMPTFVLWIISDLRARRVVGGWFWFQLLLSLVPVWGLLIYLVWTRRLIGVLQWIVFVAALAIPAGLAAAVAHGITQFARGGHW